MNILLLVDCYFPSTRSSAKQMRDLAIEYRRLGHTVFLVTPDSALTTSTHESVDEGVTVLRVQSGAIKDVGLVRRAWNEMRLSSVIWSRAERFFREHRCDLIIQFSPTIFFAALVRRLKRLWNCPAYLILRDIFPQWAVDAGVMSKGLPYLYFRHKEREQYDSFDIIGVQSPANLDYFKARGWDKAYRFDVLYNWTTVQPPARTNVDYRHMRGLGGKVVLFYGGNIGVAQDMDNLVRLAKALGDDTRARLLIIGQGTEVPRLKALESSGAVPNLLVRDSVSQSEYAAMVGQFDVGLISLDRKLKTQNFPGKMLSYLVSGLPILASINPGNDIEGILRESGVGLVAINGDDTTFVAHARRLIDSAELRDTMGRAGRRLLLERFAVTAAAKQILRVSGVGEGSIA